MEEILDQPLIEKDKSRVVYSGFWKRFAAVIIDFIILAPISIGISYFNITSWKSTVIMLVVGLIGLGYKPIMEILYGATWGKMAVGMKVTNLDFEKADVREILMRNIFHIVPGVITMIISIGLYNSAAFEGVSGFSDYSDVADQSSLGQVINFGSGLLTIVDAIVLAADPQKRSIHDRIGGTFVVDKYSVD
jgi:uncharacterized RDD family membrane protein YckC